MLDVVAVASELIRRRSLTPDDAGCQAFFREQLERLGFACEPLRFGEVDNLWARRGESGPLLVLAGHTDVVPPGNPQAWQTDPFIPEERDGMLHGRGAADMKGGLAAMLVACERFVTDFPAHRGSLGWLITSDEEGPAKNGTVKVMEWLAQQGQRMDWCVLGEPSSVAKAGDQIKNGRRGSLTGRLRVQGVQGHVAYPHLANNPIHAFAPEMNALCAETWDQGNDHFPPTGFQIVHLQAGVGATNVIPGQLECWFNFRYSTEVTAEDLQQRVATLLANHGVQFEVEWEHGGAPFLTAEGELIDAAKKAVAKVTGRETELSTSGGTSDGRFIAPHGVQVVELGPINATIHKANECVRIADLRELSDIYYHILQQLLATTDHHA